LNKTTADEEGEENIEAENNICLPPPTLEEAKEQIKTIKNNKSPGMDNITGEMIKYGADEILKYIHINTQNMDEGKDARRVVNSSNTSYP
jgi:hypothetical protein